MSAALFTIIFNKIILPEIVRYLNERHSAGQPPPSAEEIQARIHSKVLPAIQEGEDFIASLSSTPPG